MKTSSFSPRLIRVAFASILASLVLAPVAPSAAKPKDTADFEYQVIGLDYSLQAVTSASRESGDCVAGITQDLGAAVTTSPSELSKLRLGKGEMRIGHHGTKGTVLLQDSVDFNLTGNQRLTTLCEGGTTAMSSDKRCVETKTATVAGAGIIEGPVGDAVRVTWRFTAGPRDGSWSPSLICGETIDFQFVRKCQGDSIRLERLTRRIVKIPFLCASPFTTDIPPGKGYDRYEGYAVLMGSVKLKRTKHS